MFFLLSFSDMKAPDLTHQVFGRLTVLRLYCISHDRHAVWECLCICGNMRTVLSKNLQSGATQSCGCRRKLPPSQEKPRKSRAAPEKQRHDTCYRGHKFTLENTYVNPTKLFRVCLQCRKDRDKDLKKGS